MPSAAWPIEEVWARPILTLIVAALMPFVTVRLLAALTLAAKIPDEAAAAAQAVAAFRAGALIVGVVQVQLAWTLGATALGPALIDSPDDASSIAFAAACAALTFLMGAPARAIESRSRPTLGPVLLRLRAIPWLAGPVLVATACTWLPVVDREHHVSIAYALLALVATFLGVAYAGPVLSVILRALVPAGAHVRALAVRAGQREGVRLFTVLRLPTHGARFANAAAVPWARTMIVTDHITEILDERELDAVLAHEAGHLSEPSWVSLCRLSAVSLLLFGSTTGAQIVDALWPATSTLVLAGAMIVALPLVAALLGLARRMEERADERARITVSADALADALTKLALDARAPLVTGRKHARLHPDLFDRICACGRDLGPRPEPPNRRPGLIAGALIAAGLVAIPWAVDAATRIEPGAEGYVGPTAAIWRLRADPWDPSAMLSLAWVAARDHDPGLAAARLEAARRVGARESDAIELDAERLASTGDCDAARARFEEALRVRTEEHFEAGLWTPLELGGFHVPPSLVTECGYGEGTRGTW